MPSRANCILQVQDGCKVFLSKIKNPGIDKLRIAYLLKAGMTNSQIVSVTGYASTTVWRKTKYLTEVLGDDLYSL